MAYRNRGLCSQCHNHEEREGELAKWSVLWKGRRKVASGDAKDVWMGVVLFLLSYMPGSSIEVSLGLHSGTVRLWVESGRVPHAYRYDLMEVAKRATVDAEGRSA